MKILITGANGQLGYHLQHVFADHELFLGDVHNYDITDRELIIRQTETFQPDLIIHAAAYTNVDGAESNRELAYSINVSGSKHVAEAAKLVDAKLVAISTDYVFQGDKGTPYTESDAPSPQSYYGQTKLEGEQAILGITPKHFICRTSWLYGGPKPTRGMNLAEFPYKNFVVTMLRLGKERSEVAVVSDQLGGPTYAHDLALLIKENLIATEQYGVYHLTNSGVTNWADFTREIFALAKYDTAVVNLTSDQYSSRSPQAAKRPAYSVLGHNALERRDLTLPRDWRIALADFLADY